MDQAAINLLWSLQLWQVLQGAGVAHGVICPGSRSGPLAVAATLTPGLTRHTSIDERSAAFLALGLVRGTGAPVAVLTTSGSAVAHLLPACSEADLGGLPLILLTADRPPHLKHCGANQTAPQEEFLLACVRRMVQLPLPGTTPFPGALVQEALAAARGPHCHGGVQAPGPVHVNQAFVEPLHTSRAQLQAVQRQWLAQQADAVPCPIPVIPPPLAAGSPPPLAWDQPGLIVAGPYRGHDPAAYRQHMRQLVGRTGWPVLADPCSGLRGLADLPVVSGYDLLLMDPRRLPTPNQILRLGPCSPSRWLSAWLEKAAALQVQVCEQDQRLWDPLGRIDWRSGHGLAALVAQLSPGQPSEAAMALQRGWQRQQHRLRQWLDHQLEASPVTEPWLAWAVSRWLDQQPPTTVLLANSSPIRDWESFAQLCSPHHVTCFRGVSGIDGTLSLAAGLAMASSAAQRTVLVSGDLALLHDSNGWLWRRQLQACGANLLVVLIDNGGGGIFEQLTIRNGEFSMEELFTMPQSVDQPALAAAHGVPSQTLHHPHQLREALEHGSQQARRHGMALLHCPTHARRDHQQRQRLRAGWLAHDAAPLETGDSLHHGDESAPISHPFPTRARPAGEQ
ncbi:MAG: 2-succinyl-5-enolpyruvyl-6-hydroxy-3-cyclohexene-1-carboxylic-acid synthase [Synechococcus sp. SB0673_bin_10]|nr:2-succinyl-5-enolpyruvyl-6-hydroxy-3-cyclohexene-1-carboxylic-acid synthase [Synechococcus sp. SB0673_bin_10]